MLGASQQAEEKWNCLYFLLVLLAAERSVNNKNQKSER